MAATAPDTASMSGITLTGASASRSSDSISDSATQPNATTKSRTKTNIETEPQQQEQEENRKQLNSSTPEKEETRRVRRVRSTGAVYNETLLSGRSKPDSRRKSYNDALRSVSGETLVPGQTPVTDEIVTSGNNAASDRAPVQEQLVQDSIQALNLEWTVDAMPGDAMRTSLPPSKPLRRKSTELLRQASQRVADTTRGILGKRGRDALSASKHKLSDLGRRSSLRSREKAAQEDSVQDDPPRKRTRLADTLEVPEASAAPDVKRKPTVKPRTKRWLAQGLYVGQDPNYDPRLTAAKNELKRAQSNAVAEIPRTYLPMPMFAGKRLLQQGRDFRLPWQVFSPLPAGQPKPDEWRKTRTNVFIGDAGDIWKVSKRLEHSLCVCEPESGCGDECFNRFMFYECDDTNCNIESENCTNRSFAGLRERTKTGTKYNIGVEVIKTADRGYGVRSNRSFEPHQIIVEYTGEIITQDECDKRMYNDYKNNECFYLMMFDQNMIIDATRGSIARFVNHSCEPNCHMVKWTVAGKPRMALFAGEKGVMTGEELSYDYNFDPFSSLNIQECRCGSASCRGVLGPRAKDAKEASAGPPVPPKNVDNTKSRNAAVKGQEAKTVLRTLPQARGAASRPSSAHRPLTSKSSKQSLVSSVVTDALVSQGTTKTRRKSQPVSVAVSAVQKARRASAIWPEKAHGSVKATARRLSAPLSGSATASSIKTPTTTTGRKKLVKRRPAGATTGHSAKKTSPRAAASTNKRLSRVSLGLPVTLGNGARLTSPLKGKQRRSMLGLSGVQSGVEPQDTDSRDTHMHERDDDDMELALDLDLDVAGAGLDARAAADTPDADASIRRGIVRTLRGARRNGVGPSQKSIRVIE